MAKKVAKKKLAKKKVARRIEGPKQAAHQAQEYAQEIWLAGLGAFAMAQQEGSKLFKQGSRTIDDAASKVVGESARLFERLVKEGAKLESKGRQFAADAVGGVRSDVSGRVEEVRKTAQTNWDKLEKVFEQRVARALGRLGVPSAEEIRELSDRVAELNQRVSELAKKQQAAAPAPKPKPKPATKPAAKPAAARPAAKPLSEGPKAD